MFPNSVIRDDAGDTQISRCLLHNLVSLPGVLFECFPQSFEVVDRKTHPQDWTNDKCLFTSPALQKSESEDLIHRLFPAPFLFFYVRIFLPRERTQLAKEFVEPQWCPVLSRLCFLAKQPFAEDNQNTRDVIAETISIQ